MHLKIDYLYLWNYSKSKEQKHRYNSIFGLSKYAEKAHLRFLPLLVSFHPISRILRLATFSWPIRIFEAWHCLSIISFSRVLGQRRIKIKSELANPNSVENSNGFKWFALISCCTKVRETYQLWNLKFIKIKKKKVMTSFFLQQITRRCCKGWFVLWSPMKKQFFFTHTPFLQGRQWVWCTCAHIYYPSFNLFPLETTFILFCFLIGHNAFKACPSDFTLFSFYGFSPRKNKRFD